MNEGGNRPPRLPSGTSRPRSAGSGSRADSSARCAFTSSEKKKTLLANCLALASARAQALLDGHCATDAHPNHITLMHMVTRQRSNLDSMWDYTEHAPSLFQSRHSETFAVVSESKTNCEIGAFFRCIFGAFSGLRAHLGGRPALSGRGTVEIARHDSPDDSRRDRVLAPDLLGRAARVRRGANRSAVFLRWSQYSKSWLFAKDHWWTRSRLPWSARQHALSRESALELSRDRRRHASRLEKETNPSSGERNANERAKGEHHRADSGF